ncbi:hypothetical protein [Wenyingzhuangia aestuarii]|uniref:hypothetical protein n=1 Tax=Wenyingzhuangia aestuarii TaxID=1647582 RepID=UPI00143B25D1|nr:hypothetical protein [Wenyingzhuangia aestuarii]NJB83607.1 hypothetical protein [Wenyingzhuangia aestuarii]
MNHINFQQIGGFPLETETLLEVQKAYSIFNAYGKAMGDKVIVSGCTVVGSNVSDGYIYLNDELISFKGGTLQSKIYIKEDVQNVEFADLVTKPVYYTRYATFGNTTNSIDWADFKRIDPILTLMSRMDELEKTNAVFNSGLGSVWWRGTLASIPDGWEEDTTMRGLVPVGQQVGDSNFNTLNATGGSKTQSLTVGQLPKHTPKWKWSKGVKFKTESAQDGTGYIDQDDGYHNGNSRDIDRYPIEEIGNNESHNNLQPYRVGLWIKRTIS